MRACREAYYHYIKMIVISVMEKLQLPTGDS